MAWVPLVVVKAIFLPCIPSMYSKGELPLSKPSTFSPLRSPDVIYPCAFIALQHATHRNSRKGSRRNIEAHYDLGNTFYSTWLDRTMTYSSALYGSPGDSLEQAQANKYENLAKALDLHPGCTVLEIGCGWGGFAEYAAREYGARVTGITLSKEQHAFATERLRQAGLADLTDIQLIDYRDVRGQFDRVASIEMRSGLSVTA